jgi:LuxR family maltose regulon positive regulatory protein
VWHERNGALDDAIRHALRAEDVERAAVLLESSRPALDRSYRTGRWLALVRNLPESVVRARPALDMGFAWMLLNAGELNAAEARLIDLDSSLDVSRFPALPREIATARVYLAQSRGDAAGTLEHAGRVLGLVPADDHAAHATAAALLALAHWGMGELEPAHDTFIVALASMRAAGDTQSAIRGMFVPGDIRATQGRLRDAERAYRGGLAFAAAHGTSDVSETDELQLGLAELHRERNELEQAAALLEALEQSAARAAHAGNRQRWCIAVARIAEARGEPDVALDLLAQAETHERPDPLPRPRPIAAHRARIHIAQGRLAEADQWASTSCSP